MKIARLPLLAAAGLFLASSAHLSAQLPPPLTYYYNSLDSNPYDFTGILTVPAGYPNMPVPILSFSMSAVVAGQTLNFTTSDQAGPAEALYDMNPADPLSTLFPFPAYAILNPALGGQTLVLGPQIPMASSLGAPVIYDVPSSPVVIDASDNGVWLLTPPSSAGTSVPETSSTMSLFALATAALGGFRRFHGRDRGLSF